MTVLFLVVFIGLLGFGIILPLFPFYAERFGASPEIITWTMAVYTIGQIVATPAWGRLSDAWGRRPVLVLSLLGTTLAYVMLAFADSLEMVILSRVFAGLMAGNTATAFAYVADVTTPETRAAGMGRIGAGLALGFMLGPAVGGLLAGDDVATADYVLPALGAGALSLVAMVGAVFLPESLPPALRRPFGTPRRAAGDGAAGRGAGAMLRLALLPLMAATLFFYVAMSSMESVFSLWANDAFGYGPRSIGAVFFVMGAIQAVVQAGLVGWLSRRFGERRLAMGGCAVVAAGLAVLAGATAGWELWLGVALFSLAVGAINPALSSLVSRTARADEYGTVMGWYQSAGAVGRVLGPGMSGALYAQVGIGAPFAVAAAVMLPALAFVALFRAGAVRAPGGTGRGQTD